MMRGVALSLLCLLLILVEVQCQSFPYVSFMGQTLANHSYVDLSLVGVDDSGSDSVQCHTNLTTCCTELQGGHRGNWYFPDRTRLPSHGGGDIYRSRGAQRIDLRHRNSATSTTGLYRCHIPVHDPTDTSVKGTVYVGLYNTSGGDLMISGGITFDNDLQTLTCISTGGPATNVTWTGDSATVTEGTETVLNDPVTANYTHTLNVTAAGEYTCTVTNNKPSTASANITIEVASAPTGVAAVQDGATSIRVSWTPPSPLGATTGYTISYSGGGSSDSVTVDGGSTNSHTLTGLTNGETYTISIAGTSTGLSSAPVEAMAVGLVPAPGEVRVAVSFIAATSISLSWSVASGQVASSEVVWRETDRGIESSSGSLPGTSYTIDQFESSTTYTITVRATNPGGTTESSPITFSTAPDVCQVEENSVAAIVGGVVGAVAVTLAATAIVAVVIMMVLRSRVRSQATNTTSGAVGVPSATSEAIELSKFSEATTGDPDKFQTTSNEAYNAVRQAGGTVEGDYENPMTLFSLSSSHPRTTTAATASDSLYEAV